MDSYMHPFRGGPGEGGPGFFMDGPHHGGPGPLAWALFALELVAILGIVWLVASSVLRHQQRNRFFFRHAPGPWGPSGGGVAALDLLQMRYARGEIGRAEYLQTRDDLGAPPQSAPPPSEAPTQA